MTQWIRWWGLGLFAAIALLWWLCIDAVIELAIETAGTQANGAKVELASAEFSLAPASLRLSGLAVTNPNAPMENLLFSDDIEMQLDSLLLLRRHIVAEKMAITGLRINSPRSSSGAIGPQAAPGKETTEDASAESSGFTLPGVPLPDTSQLIADEKTKLRNQLDQSKAKLKALEDQWQQRLDELPDKEAIDVYKARWKKIKKQNVFKQLTGAKELRKDIKRDLKKFKNLKQQLRDDIAKAKAEVARAKAMPGEATDRLLAEAGLSEQQQSFVKGLFDGQLKQWYRQANDMLKKVSGGADKSAENQTPPRGEGRWIHFSEQTSTPDVLIKTATIDGSTVVNGTTINFKGTAENLSHQPARWHKPATLKLTGNSDNGASAEVNGEFDHRISNRDEIHFTVKQLPLSELPLGSSDDITIALNKAKAAIQGKAVMENQQLQISSKSQFKEVAIQTSGKEDSSTVKAFAAALADVRAFQLDVNASGSPDAPELSIKSDLDRVLGRALKEQAQQQLAGLKTKIEQELNEGLQKEINELTGQSDKLSSLLEIGRASCRERVYAPV